MAPLQFPEWLQEQLDSRGWDQAKLAKRSGLTRGAISHVLNGDRQAGVDFCIAMARAFGIAREEVFKVRGWLLQQPSPVISVDANPRLVEMAEAVQELDFAQQELILDVWEATLKAIGIRPKK